MVALPSGGLGHGFWAAGGRAGLGRLRGPTAGGCGPSGGGDQEVGGCPIAGDRNVADHRDPQQCLDVGVVRLGLQRIPQEHQQIDLALGDPGTDLLVTAEHSGPLRKQVAASPSRSCSRRPVVAVANSSCPASMPMLYSAHSSMSCFLWSWAISAIRRPVGAGRTMAIQVLSVVSV